jgi:hypothetical protein
MKGRFEQTVNLGLHGTWATRVILAGLGHFLCEHRERGRSWKREPTRAYHSLRVGESNMFDFESCTGKHGVKQQLATRPRR